MNKLLLHKLLYTLILLCINFKQPKVHISNTTVNILQGVVVKLTLLKLGCTLKLVSKLTIILEDLIYSINLEYQN